MVSVVRLPVLQSLRRCCLLYTSVNPWADGSERKPIAGMTKERYGGIALYIKERTPEDMGFLKNCRQKLE